MERFSISVTLGKASDPHGAKRKAVLSRTVRPMPMRRRNRRGCLRGENELQQQKGITKREPAVCRFPFHIIVFILTNIKEAVLGVYLH